MLGKVRFSLVILSLFVSNGANANAILNIDQVGLNVRASYSGSLDLPNLRLLTSYTQVVAVQASTAYFGNGMEDQSVLGYTGIMGPVSWGNIYPFGAGLAAVPSFHSGDTFGISGGNFSVNGRPAPTAEVFVLPSYVSGADLSGIEIFSNTTLETIGLTRGIYVYTGPGNVVTVNIGDAAAVPESETWSLMIGGFGLVGAAMRRRQTVSVTCA